MKNLNPTVYVQMSNAGRVVAIFDKPPTKKQRHDQYEQYLGKALDKDAAEWNCWIERWVVNGQYSCPHIVRHSKQCKL